VSDGFLSKLYIPHCNASISRRYGDITVTYICMVEMSSHIYTLSISKHKNQSTQESEYRSTVVIYISAIITQVHSYHRV